MNEEQQRLEQDVIEAAESYVAFLDARYGPHHPTCGLHAAVRSLQAARRPLPTEPGWWWGSEGDREPEPMFVKNVTGVLRTRIYAAGWVPVDTEHVTWLVGPNPRKAQRALPWTRS